MILPKNSVYNLLGYKGHSFIRGNIYWSHAIEIRVNFLAYKVLDVKIIFILKFE